MIHSRLVSCTDLTGRNGLASRDSSLGLSTAHRDSCSAIDKSDIRTRYVHASLKAMYTVETPTRTAFLDTSSYIVTSWRSLTSRAVGMGASIGATRLRVGNWHRYVGRQSPDSSSIASSSRSTAYIPNPTRLLNSSNQSTTSIPGGCANIPLFWPL